MIGTQALTTGDVVVVRWESADGKREHAMSCEVDDYGYRQERGDFAKYIEGRMRPKAEIALGPGCREARREVREGAGTHPRLSEEWRLP